MDLSVGQDYFDDGARFWHASATAVALLVWFATRGRRVHSVETLNAIDAAGTIAVSASFAVMARLLFPGVGALIGLLAISYVTLGRAAQLPSTPRRTLAISAVSFASVVVSTMSGAVPPGYAGLSVGRLFATIDTLLWAIAGTALTTVASKVIYGLQEKVFEARQLGQYTLESKIGGGGMGEVYRARHAMLRRPTAIKLLPGEHSEAQLKRFEREVQLTASLTHPNTISVFDFGRTPEGTFYYAMELLDGLNLETLVEEHGPQPPGRVVHILTQVCGALAEAHGVGLIHRDIKPANVYLCKIGGIDDFVKVLDFGLVRNVNQDVTVSQSSAQTLIGTPLYMSPEAVVSPESVGTSADLYSLGATAYYLLSGSAPFRANTAVEVFTQHLHAQPEPPSRRLGSTIPAALETIVLDCLAKDPAARPSSAAALAERLQALTDVPAWSPEQARQFWDTARSTVSVQAPRPTAARTVRVDLGDRFAVPGNDRESA
jgi:serine/threonine-protein kinase